MNVSVMLVWRGGVFGGRGEDVMCGQVALTSACNLFRRIQASLIIWDTQVRGWQMTLNGFPVCVKVSEQLVGATHRC